MRNRIPVTFLMLTGLLAPATAAAENPSFSFVELRAGQIDVKDSSVTESGAQLGFSYGFSESFHFFTETGQFGEIDAWKAGFGWRKPTTENTTIYFEYGHLSFNEPTGQELDGKVIEVGFRTRPNDSIEVDVVAHDLPTGKPGSASPSATTPPTASAWV